MSEETRRFEKNFYIFIFGSQTRLKIEDFKMTYEIAYARENENMCEIKKVVILIHSRTLKRLKMSYYTNKPSIYHEGKFIVRNYTEDQVGTDIRKEDMVQARNGWYYTLQEIETWKVKNMQDLLTYGNCG